MENLDSLSFEPVVSDVYVEETSLYVMTKRTRKLLKKYLKLQALKARFEGLRNSIPKLRKPDCTKEVILWEEERIQGLQEHVDKRKEIIIARSEDLHSRHQEQKELLNEMMGTQERIEQERKKLQDLEWELDLRRYKKCNQISKIFPMEEKELKRNLQEKGFCIRHIWLPKNTENLLHRMTYSQDTQNFISTALGYICLLVTLLSKYLNVSLLHEMTFCASTSKIQDDKTTFVGSKRPDAHVYSLCHGPNTENMRLKQALSLLMENILQLCRARGVTLESSDYKTAIATLQPLYLLLAKEALV